MNVIASPMSPLFNTIEEFKQDHDEKKKFVQNQQMKQQLPNVKYLKQNDKQSIFSLSNILTAFSNSSFSNLGSISSFKLASKIADKSCDDITVDTNNSADTTSTIQASKRRQIKNECLTLHIVGIRDIRQLENDTSIESFISQLKQKTIAENKNDSNKTQIEKSKFIFEKKEEKTGLFGDDDSSSSSSDSDSSDGDNNDTSSSAAIPPLFDSDSENDTVVSSTNETEEKKIGLCLKTIKTDLTSNSTVKELKEYLSLNNIFKLEKYLIFQLFYSNICVNDDYRSLGYYGISNNSFILAAILEGKPMNYREYSNEIEKFDLVIGSEPAEFKSKDAKQVIYQAPRQAPIIGNAALLAFTRRHIQNVHNGVTQAPRPATTARSNQSDVKLSDKLKHLDMQDLVSKFKIERMSCIDFITYVEDDSCIKMPCGHGMHPESLLGYVLSEVNRKDTLSITCPHLIKDKKTGKESLCGKEWHYPIIKKILIDNIESNCQKNGFLNNMKPEYLLNFMKMELLIARNMLQETYDAQKCGHCGTVLFRKEKNLSAKMSDFQAVCPLCTISNREQLFNENKKEIAQLEAKIAELKKRHKTPQIIKTIKRVRRRLRLSKVRKDMSKFQKNINSKMNMISISNLKSKFTISNLLLDSIDEIEANGEKFNNKNQLKRKRYRRQKKIKTIDTDTIYASFVNSFHTADDSSSSSDDELELKQREKEKIKNDKNQVKGIFNPYLGYDSEDAEYEYVTDDSNDDIDSDSENDNDSSDDSGSSAPVPLLFESDDNDGDGDNDNDSSDSSSSNINYDVSSFVCSDIEMKDNPANINSSPRNEYYFGDSDISQSDSETDIVAQQRRNLFNTESDSSDNNSSDSDSDSDDNEKKNENKEIIKPKTELEIQIERMEYKLDRMRMRTFDNVKHNIMLCWGCGVAWKDVSSPACGNSDCSTSFRAQILSILRECPTKKIGSQKDVPSVRACVKCGQLINHWECCKHIQCRKCDTNFCFVCLKPYIKGGRGWQCGSYSSKCPDGVKKRQDIKDLPSMNVATVKLFDL